MLNNQKQPDQEVTFMTTPILAAALYPAALISALPAQACDCKQQADAEITLLAREHGTHRHIASRVIAAV
jgi:hypothetical protein